MHDDTNLLATNCVIDFMDMIATKTMTILKVPSDKQLYFVSGALYSASNYDPAAATNVLFNINDTVEANKIQGYLNNNLNNTMRTTDFDVLDSKLLALMHGSPDC